MENNNWSDRARLFMIDKAKFYSDKNVYHYGFYDGYQYANDKNNIDTYNLRELLNDLNYNIETSLQNGADNLHITYLKNLYNKLSSEITRIESTKTS